MHEEAKALPRWALPALLVVVAIASALGIYSGIILYDAIKPNLYPTCRVALDTLRDTGVSVTLYDCEPKSVPLVRVEVVPQTTTDHR